MSNVHGTFQQLHIDALGVANGHKVDMKTKLDTIAANTANIKLSTDSVNLNVDTLEALQTTNNTTVQALDDRLHSFSGHTNNTTAIGDGSDQLRTVGLGYDRTNQKVRSILVDSGGKQVVDNPTFDALIGHTNNTTSVGDGANQLRVVPLGYDRSNGKAVSFLVDADGHQQSDIVSSALPSGASTSANQSTINTSIGTGNTTLSSMNTNVVALEASLTSMESKQDTQVTHLSEIEGAVETIEACVSSNKVNVNIASGSTATDVSALATHAKQDTINTSITSTNSKIDTIDSVLDASLVKQTNLETLITSTNSKIDTFDSVLDASLVKQTNLETLITTLDGVQDNILTKLTAIDSDTNDIKTAVEILDNAISGSEMQVDVVASLPAGNNNIGNVDIASALPAGTNSIGTVNLGSTDNAVLDDIAQKLGDIETAVQVLDNAISGSEMQVDVVAALPAGTNNIGDVDIASALPAGTNSIGTVNLGSTDNAVLDDIAQKLGDIETAVQLIDNAISGSEMQVDVVAALPAGDNNIGNVDVASALPAGDNNIGNVDIASALPAGTNSIGTVNLGSTDNAVLDDIAQKLGDIETAVQVIDNAISGSEMQVDVVAALPAGDNNIGNVDIASAIPAGTNSIGTVNLGATDNAVLDAIETTNNACQVLLGTIDSDTDAIKTSVQLIDDVVKAEDAAHSSGDKGVMALAIHQTTATSLGANGDYTPLSVNANQHLRTANELIVRAFTIPSSGVIGSSASATSSSLKIEDKTDKITVIVRSTTTTDNWSLQFTGSVDDSAYWTISSSWYGQTNFTDNDKVAQIQIPIVFKYIKVFISNSGSSATFVAHLLN